MRTFSVEGFIAFLEYVIKFEDEPKRKIKVSANQRLWIEHVFDSLPKKQNPLIKAPWEHGKSQIIAIGWPLWMIGLNHETRGAIICATDANAKKRVMAIRAYIKRDKDYARVFPHVKPQPGEEWSKHALTVNRTSFAKDYTLEAAGVDAAGTGTRLDWLVADDICDIKDQQSEKIRESRDESFRNQWLSRLHRSDRPGNLPSAFAIYIATPWHLDDVTGRLCQEPGWNPMHQRVARDYSGIETFVGHKYNYEGEPEHRQPLWEFANRAILEEKLMKLGSKVFRAGIFLDIVSEEDATFDWKRCETASIKFQQRPSDLFEWDWPMFAGVDLSTDKRPGTAIYVIARRKDGLRVPVHIEAGRWPIGPETARQIVMVDNLIREAGGNIRLWMVENNAQQEAIINCLREIDKSFKVKGFHTGNNKVDQALGLPGMAAQLEAGGWAIGLKGHNLVSEKRCHMVPYATCAWCRLIRELKEHPFSSSSDLVMAMWFADQAAGKQKKLPKTISTDIGAKRQYASVGTARLFGPNTAIRVFKT